MQIASVGRALRTGITVTVMAATATSALVSPASAADRPSPAVSRASGEESITARQAKRGLFPCTQGPFRGGDEKGIEVGGTWGQSTEVVVYNNSPLSPIPGLKRWPLAIVKFTTLEPEPVTAQSVIIPASASHTFKLPAVFDYEVSYKFNLQTWNSISLLAYTVYSNYCATMSVEDVTVREPTAAPSTDAVFRVKLSQPLVTSREFLYRTADVDATAPGDYTARKGFINFSPGQTEVTIRVPVHADQIGEEPEKFTLVIEPTGPSEVRLPWEKSYLTASATIIDTPRNAPIVIDEPSLITATVFSRSETALNSHGFGLLSPHEVALCPQRGAAMCLTGDTGTLGVATGELIFYLDDLTIGSRCVSTDPVHAQIVRESSTAWIIWWEDRCGYRADTYFNDLIVRVTATPITDQ